MKANVRRAARERALQLLFMLEKNPPERLETAVQRFWDQQRMLEREAVANMPGHRSCPDVSGSDAQDDERLRAFAERLVAGVRQHQRLIDERLEGYLDNWRLDRLGGIERNVLRIAFYELFHEQDVPPVVCINEAVDLAKYFCATGSGRFVNGVLDRARKAVPRDPRRNPSPVNMRSVS